MLARLYQFYALLFARPLFRIWNESLFHLSLRGMGVLNFPTDHLSGEAAWLQHYLSKQQQAVVLDVGANEGQYAALVLQVNTKLKLFSFEPHPHTFQKLQQRWGQTAGVKLLQVGVGDEVGQMSLFDHAEADGSQHASLYKGVIEDLHQQKAVAHTVDIIKIDDFIKEEQLETIDLLKIDTEGHEYKVLLGAMGAIRTQRIKAIHLEFNEMNVISRQTFKDFWDLLPNYTFHRVLPGGRLLPIRQYQPILCELFAYQNLVLLLKKGA